MTLTFKLIFINTTKIKLKMIFNHHWWHDRGHRRSRLSRQYTCHVTLSPISLRYGNSQVNHYTTGTVFSSWFNNLLKYFPEPGPGHAGGDSESEHHQPSLSFLSSYVDDCLKSLKNCGNNYYIEVANCNPSLLRGSECIPNLVTMPSFQQCFK